MKKILFVLAMIIAIAIFSTACSGNKNADESYDDSTSPPSMGDSGGPSESTGGDNNGGQILAGQLTAAEWNDNIHYDKWLELFGQEQEQEQENPGVFEAYLQQWEFNTLNRIVVNVTNNENAVFGAVVKVYSGSDLKYSAISDAKGKAYLFIKSVEEDENLTIEVVIGEQTVTESVAYAKNMEEVNIEVAEVQAKLDKLEIMFVIDTTGSMGDELNYLKAEIKDVINQVKLANPATEITIALLFYRDIGDEYVTRYFNFESDLDNVNDNISAQRAAGGGDYPEAVHTALSEAMGKQWSSGNSTKLIIHVLDAPPHDNTNDMLVYENSIYEAARMGIRLIPVASSGIDKATEYLLRNQALLTGGTYVFLTNESGIGLGHIDPSIDGYVVEYLNALLARVINELHTGIYVEPVPYNQQNQ